MKDFLFRVWNTIKIPLVILIVVLILKVVEELKAVGNFSTIITWEFWENSIYLLSLMALPAISGALDKWLRDHGIFIEQIFNGFKLPASK